MPESPFQKRLRRLMEEQDVSQADLARRIWGEVTEKRFSRAGTEYETSVAKNRQVMASWASGRSEPTARNLVRLANALGTDPHYLKTGERDDSGVIIGAVDDKGLVQVDIVAKVPVHIARAIHELVKAG